MSNRTLLEINHDYDLEEMPGFLTALARYRRSACQEHAEALKRYGVTVVGMRHHTEKFIIDGSADGFPVHYLTPSTKGKGNAD